HPPSRAVQRRRRWNASSYSRYFEVAAVRRRQPLSRCNRASLASVTTMCNEQNSRRYSKVNSKNECPSTTRTKPCHLANGVKVLALIKALLRIHRTRCLCSEVRYQQRSAMKTHQGWFAMLAFLSTVSWGAVLASVHLVRWFLSKARRRPRKWEQRH